jgi:hypothetical protein
LQRTGLRPAAERQIVVRQTGIQVVVKIIPDDQFLTWAAEAGLVPDPRYPLSKQLVFQRNPTCWRPWPLPPSAERITAFLEAMIRQAGGGGVLRTRLRGGGSWHLRNPESNRQFAIEDALRRVGVPSDVRGALEFGVEERAVAVDLAQAYALSGWHIGTDLEIVPLERTWCLMLSHHDEVIMHLPSGEHLSALSRRMKADGYPDCDDSDGV